MNGALNNSQCVLYLPVTRDHWGIKDQTYSYIFYRAPFNVTFSKACLFLWGFAAKRKKKADHLMQCKPVFSFLMDEYK